MLSTNVYVLKNHLDNCYIIVKTTEHIFIHSAYNTPRHPITLLIFTPQKINIIGATMFNIVATRIIIVFTGIGSVFRRF